MGVKEEGNLRSPSQGILIPQSWEAAVDNIVYDSTSYPPPITFICGPGNSGKSTFSRHLLNTLLMRYRRVAYLDTDVGQPEFTATGCVSLHIIDKQTPDLTVLYLKKPERCVFFGHVSAKQESEGYSSCVNVLYDYFRQEFYQIKIDNPCKILLPLIINTSGWVKGTGYEILVAMLRHTSPTHVVKVCVASESKNLPNGLFWLENPSKKSVDLIQIYGTNDFSYRPGLMRKEAGIMRDIRIIAYFRQCLPRDMNFTNQQELAESLASIPSNGIPLSNIKVNHNGCQVSTGVVSHGLNATIVGLGVSYSSVLTENNVPWCIGLGIVRAVDTTNDLIFILTPVPLSTLEEVEVLIQSTLDLPACLQQISGCRISLDNKVMQKQQLTE